MAFIHKDYLGDAVYAFFDGYAIWLRANDPNDPTDQICIDPNVLSALNRFAAGCKNLELFKHLLNKGTDRPVLNKKPDCYKCAHRKAIPEDCHSKCDAVDADIEGSPHGIKNGWFMWPFNYDPRWLVYCDSFKEKEVATEAC